MKKSDKKNVVIAAAALLVVCCGVGGLYVYGRGQAKAGPSGEGAAAVVASAVGADASPVDIARYAATDAFGNLPYDQKEPYLKRLRDAMETNRDQFDQLSEDERRAAFRNSFREMMQHQVDQYFSAPIGPQRTKVLDAMIDDMQKRQAQREKSSATTRPGRGGGQAGGGQGGGGQGNGGPGGGAPNAGRGGDRRGDANADGNRAPRGSAGRQKERTENADPAKMAQMAEFFSAVRERAEQRGVQMNGGRWGR